MIGCKNQQVLPNKPIRTSSWKRVASKKTRCAPVTTADIATKGGQFDVMTIGMYETPIWGKKGWLREMKTDAAYDVDDDLPRCAMVCPLTASSTPFRSTAKAQC